MDIRHHQTLYETEKYHWWYAVRRLIVRNLILKYRPNAADRKIKLLDVGCGTGELLRELEPLAETFGIDSSSQAIAFCKERGLKNVSVAEATQVPFPDNAFDAVLCLDVLEHVKDDETVLKEIFRVTKPGGTAIVFVPTFKILWGTSDEVSHHLRRYRLTELRKKMSRNGFKIIRSSYFNFFLFLPILAVRWLVRLLKIPIKSENETGKGLINNLLSKIFGLEANFLKRMNFPFGVSGLVVSRKPD